MPRRLLISATLGIAVLVVAYTVYWFLLARTVDRDIAAWVGFYRQQGYAISYSRARLDGFPFGVEARFLAPDVAAPHGLWHWRGAETRLVVLPWAPYDLQVTAPGHHQLSLGGPEPREVAITARAIALDLHLKEGIDPDRFELTLNDAAIDDGRANVTVIGHLGADGRFPAYAPSASGSHSSLDVIAHLSRVVLPQSVASPLGREVQSLHLVAQVMGTLPDLAPRQSLEAWSALGGDVELRNMELSWGALWLKGDATLALDRALQPELAGSFIIGNLDQLLAQLAAAGVLSPTSVTSLKMMLVALAGTPSDGARREVKLPLTIQDSTLYMGPLQLARLRPIDWSWLP
jgi:hypothetical protein